MCLCSRNILMLGTQTIISFLLHFSPWMSLGQYGLFCCPGFVFMPCWESSMWSQSFDSLWCRGIPPVATVLVPHPHQSITNLGRPLPSLCACCVSAGWWIPPVPLSWFHLLTRGSFLAGSAFLRASPFHCHLRMHWALPCSSCLLPALQVMEQTPGLCFPLPLTCPNPSPALSPP